MKKFLGLSFKGDFFPEKGMYKGVPYIITEEKNERYLLNKLSIGLGMGLDAKPVGFFPKNEAEPFYYEDIKDGK